MNAPLPTNYPKVIKQWARLIERNSGWQKVPIANRLLRLTIDDRCSVLLSGSRAESKERKRGSSKTLSKGSMDVPFPSRTRKGGGLEERGVGQFGKEVGEGAVSSGAKQQPSGSQRGQARGTGRKREINTAWQRGAGGGGLVGEDEEAACDGLRLESRTGTGTGRQSGQKDTYF